MKIIFKVFPDDYMDCAMVKEFLEESNIKYQELVDQTTAKIGEGMPEQKLGKCGKRVHYKMTSHERKRLLAMVREHPERSVEETLSTGNFKCSTTWAHRWLKSQGLDSASRRALAEKKLTKKLDDAKLIPGQK